MKTLTFKTLFIFLASSMAMAQTSPMIPPSPTEQANPQTKASNEKKIVGQGGETFSSVIGGYNSNLNAKEQAAIRQAERWISRNIRPTNGKDGAVIFTYGSMLPDIVCTPVKACDLALQEGETVNDVHVGDAARWSISPAVSGDGKNKRVHAIIKPLDVGISTNVVITTNRRAYHLNLRSHSQKYMPYIAFFYPDDTRSAWNKINAEIQATENNSIGLPNLTVDDLNFEYALSGSKNLRPNRVFDDGDKTYIEVSEVMQKTELPILMIKTKNGSQIVNYRVKMNYYIVDRLFDEAHLILGVGFKGQKAKIKRKTKVSTQYASAQNSGISSSTGKRAIGVKSWDDPYN